MRSFKWIVLGLVGGLILLYLLQFVYFKSISSPPESFLYPSYETIASSYASFNVIDYSPQEHREPVSLAMNEFAETNNMAIEYGSFLQVEALSLILKRKDIRVKVVNLDDDDNFLYVFLYKEEFWENLSEQEHQVFFDKLIRVFRDMNLQIIDIKRY